MLKKQQDLLRRIKAGEKIPMKKAEEDEEEDKEGFVLMKKKE